MTTAATDPGVVYTAAGYRLDGSDRVSDFHGTHLRELRLVKQL
jgi:hypothetical protein